ncbi:uncharacterized protein LOC130669489 isoform X1 [Microplitis mediator]|uniref:uncharacterized protein LOC130669489 isoform X1 n=1 Tax=Microplitis mediator TaxID=375433 RepID=UPI0025526DD7|nr:uncharacterized protein LOC130669489 isoform X1 [Microplitis mediator]XP_057328411.1 uncharacterized protein LOC130669489 isoform X1 [Microplitis mediator]
MSRPILSRPRTRVYDCNYDKGESYYKPMMDHLDRKYSARPLFPESRASFADEIAARRSDIGSRDLSGSRNCISNFDFESDLPRPSKQPSLSLYGGTYDDDEENIVYDIRGQRTNRLKLKNDFPKEVASTTQRFKAHAASLSYDTEHCDELRESIKQHYHDIADRIMKTSKSTKEEKNLTFNSHSSNNIESNRECTSPIKWSKVSTLESDSNTNAAVRARQSKARLQDLENEIEEIAERQAKRERRAVALKTFVTDNTFINNKSMEQSEKKTTLNSSEKKDKYVNF